MTTVCQPVPSYATHPLDDTLRFNHLQALGTHNSYHIEPEHDAWPDWRYTHAPLNVQLGSQGVRQVEIDIHFDRKDNLFRVYHIPLLDDRTTCKTLIECLSALRCWSDSHPDHHPIMVMIEPKVAPSDDIMDIWTETLENEILSVWPRHRLITPDSVQQDADNVRDGIERYGWPTLAEIRGHVLFMLHTNDKTTRSYTFGNLHTQGRVMFPDARGNESLPYAGMHSVNDPLNESHQIRALVEQGHLVRTRTDASNVEALASDYSRYDAALASGAHFLSTDYPAEVAGVDYAVQIPGGTPSRCNPVSAPAECTATGIENILRPSHD